eukprot:scaffold35423_cov35-Prasinocladus_malaysianus.AAC.1
MELGRGCYGWWGLLLYVLGHHARDRGRQQKSTDHHYATVSDHVQPVKGAELCEKNARAAELMFSLRLENVACPPPFIATAGFHCRKPL